MSDDWDIEQSDWDEYDAAPVEPVEKARRLTKADVIAAYKEWDTYRQLMVSLRTKAAEAEHERVAVECSEWPAHRRFTEVAEAYAIQLAARAK
jgi:hypothetical protein